LPPDPAHRRFPGYAPTRIVDAARAIAAELGLAGISVKDESHRSACPRSRSSARRGRCYRLLLGMLGREPECTDFDGVARALAPLGPLTLVAAKTGITDARCAHGAHP